MHEERSHSGVRVVANSQVVLFRKVDKRNAGARQGNVCKADARRAGACTADARMADAR